MRSATMVYWMSSSCRRDSHHFLFGIAVFIFGCLGWSIAAEANDGQASPSLKSIIHNSGEAAVLRNRLIKTIWNSNDVPRGVAVEAYGKPQLTIASDNIQRATTLHVPLAYGLESFPYYFQVQDYQNCLLIYHLGHEPPLTDRNVKELLLRFVNAGCDAIVLSMPLFGQNSPVAETENRFGRLRLRNHDSLGLLRAPGFDPTQLFMDPIVRSLNYAEIQRGGITTIYMVGLSGGGWATTLYAAIDPRITASFPIAGTLPMSLRTYSEKSMGDWEQLFAPIYEYADYQDLYLLGTFPNRTQIQLLNVNDPCCFEGKSALSYASWIADTASKWGGKFSVSLDEITKKHEVGAQHVETISSFAAGRGQIIDRACDPNSEQIALPATFSSENGFAFVAQIPALQMLADNPDYPNRSPFVLCEDVTPLVYSHSSHAMVRTIGAGTYSHWTTYLLFTASDNSDPNKNGRKYWLSRSSR